MQPRWRKKKCPTKSAGKGGTDQRKEETSAKGKWVRKEEGKSAEGARERGAGEVTLDEREKVRPSKAQQENEYSQDDEMMAAAKRESIKTAEAKAKRTQREAAAETSGVLTVSNEKRKQITTPT